MVNRAIPAKKSNSASQQIFWGSQKNVIFSIPMTATPAAEPIIIALPQIPVERT